MFFPIGHKGEQAQGMASALGAMAVGFATAPMGEDKRAWQSAGGDAKLGQQEAFAASQAHGIGAGGRMRQDHLIVIIQTEQGKNNTMDACFLVSWNLAESGMPRTPPRQTTVPHRVVIPMYSPKRLSTQPNVCSSM